MKRLFSNAALVRRVQFRVMNARAAAILAELLAVGIVEAVETACAACQTSCLTMRSIGRWRTTTSAGSAGTCFVTGSLKTPFN